MPYSPDEKPVVEPPTLKMREVAALEAIASTLGRLEHMALAMMWLAKEKP